MCESVSVCFCVCSFVGTSVSVSIVLMSVAVSEYCVCTFLLSACSSAFEYVCLFVCLFKSILFGRESKIFPSFFYFSDEDVIELLSGRCFKTSFFSNKHRSKPNQEKVL